MRKQFIRFGLAAAFVMTSAIAVVAAQDTTTTGSPWLGVRIVTEAEQVVIDRVLTGSPAAEFGLLEGDIVTAINGTAVTSLTEMTDVLATAAVGDVLTLEIDRAGEAVTVEVTLGTDPRAGRNQIADPIDWAERFLNADLEAVDGGFEVADVLANRNPFSLEVGDIIASVNGLDIATLDLQALHEGLMSSEATALTLEVTRDGEPVTLEVAAADLMGMRGMGMGGRGDGFGPGGQGQGGRGPGGQGHGGRGDGFGPGMQGQPGTDGTQPEAPVPPQGGSL